MVGWRFRPGVARLAPHAAARRRHAGAAEYRGSAGPAQARHKAAQKLYVAAMLLAAACLPSVAAADTAGLERISVPRADGANLAGAIWYPSSSPAFATPVGLAASAVAPHGAIAGNHLPLVVISHGALGTWAGHADTAAALARAGFVVAAVTHDEVGADGTLKLAGRGRQVSALIDFALHDWHGHARIDASQIGVFGFSVGGFTALVLLGGKPDARQIAPHCRRAPAEWSCGLGAAHQLEIAANPPRPEWWSADRRIKAAVVAAPALGYLFGKTGLSAVNVPVQLWRAERDHVLVWPWSATPVARDLPAPPDYHVVPGADHADFTAPCAAGVARRFPRLCRDPSGFDRAAFHVGFNNAVVGFFTRWLMPGRK
jgi:predicted dienelactone hydrolase